MLWRNMIEQCEKSRKIIKGLRNYVVQCTKFTMKDIFIIITFLFFNKNTLYIVAIATFFKHDRQNDRYNDKIAVHIFFFIFLIKKNV
jgi:hypothetical protein